MRGPSLFTERNLARVFRVLTKLGIPARVEIDSKTGTISIIHTPVEPVAEKAADPVTSWDEALGRRS